MNVGRRDRDESHGLGTVDALVSVPLVSHPIVIGMTFECCTTQHLPDTDKANVSQLPIALEPRHYEASGSSRDNVDLLLSELVRMPNSPILDPYDDSQPQPPGLLRIVSQTTMSGAPPDLDFAVDQKAENPLSSPRPLGIVFVTTFNIADEVNCEVL